MAERFEGDDAAANGFGRRTLHEDEAHALYKAGYMAPPDMRVPGDWRLSAGGIPILSEPRGNAREEAMIGHYYGALTLEQRAKPQWNLDNAASWDSFFCQRRLLELSRYDGNGPPPPNKNSVARRIWWGAPGRTLADVLKHIAGGNEPRLEFPSLQRRWAPRRMASGSSSSSSSSRSSSRASASSALRIGGPPSSGTRHPKMEVDDGSTSGLKKPKPEVVEAAWTPLPEYRAG